MVGELPKMSGSIPRMVASQRSSPTSFIRCARDYHKTLQLLETGTEPPSTAVTLLAGHCLEVGLKAFLFQVGWEEKKVRALQHDLDNAWEGARREGLNLASDLPWWFEALASAHRPPYFSRYPKDNQGIVRPPLPQLISELGKVLDKISEEIAQRRGTL